MMQGAPPPGLGQLAGGDPDGGQGAGDGGLQCLQDVMTKFPELLQELHDPTDVQAATQALQILAKVQSRIMGANGGPAASGG